MLTIVTPTYNRGYILEKLYLSLEAQTDKNFEWLVIDDGSNDNTKQLLDKWYGEAGFKMQWFFKENGGNHRAINYAMPHIETDFVLIVDSDDYLCDDAVETVNKWISEPLDDMWAAVSGHRGRICGEEINVIGQMPKYDKIAVSPFERRKFGLMGDKAEVWRADLLRKYPFPEYEGEKFLTEDVVWNKMALDGYKILYYNKIIMICEYREDGLTLADPLVKFKNNIKGWCDSYRQNWEGLPFPWNYSCIAEFYKYCRQEYLLEDVFKKTIKLNKGQYFLVYLCYKIKKILKSKR